METMSVNGQAAHAPPIEETIDAAFEAQVRRTPNAIALTQAGVHVTYEELNRRADALASRLLESGVTLETTVGILLDRSIGMVVAILAVFKAGGAYVPMDPGQPDSRLAYILSDSAPRVVITTSDLRPRLPADHERIVCMDFEKATDDTGGIGPRVSRSHRKALAHVIYTSGSTGAPKGVMVEHNSVTRFIKSIEELLLPSPQDTWVLVHSFAFDYSVLEVWGCLLYGGRLVISSFETVRTPAAFFDLLCAEGATVVSQTPSAFRQLVAAQEINSIRPPLRLIILGGEAVDKKSVRRWHEVVGDAERPAIVNMYGPTETTVFVTAKRLSARDAQNVGNSSPIGTPLAGAEVHVLDESLQPAPAGAVGEMFISGVGVARGYLNRPSLTAQRFVADPVDSDDMSRMYRTGDRGRKHADGQLEYLGRNDFQVKIRGYRVELGEIEANLAAHSDVDGAVVIVREDVPGRERLTAYHTTRGDHPPSSAVLRTFLAARLPEHMIPTDFIWIPSLPLTANGKINRAALPKPGLETLDVEYDPPQGEVEETLAAIWQEVLGLDRIGREENFFERGGSSMMGMSLTLRVAEHFKIEPDVAFVFQHSSVRRMAEFVEERLLSERRECRPAATEEGMEQGSL